MGSVTEYPELERIGETAQQYPAQYLEGLETGLCLFGAAFSGANDAIHFYEHGLRTNVVDTDFERLSKMRRLYPDDWQFVHVDAWEYAEAARREELAFDAVSVDTFTGDAEIRSLASLELWTSIANELVTVTATPGKPFDVPDGWIVSKHWRGPGVYWLCLRRSP